MTAPPECRTRTPSYHVWVSTGTLRLHRIPIDSSGTQSYT
jgi:hypothetical protein